MNGTIEALIFAFLFTGSSCTSQQLMDFYYPIEEERVTNIYVYTNPKDVTLDEYWKVTTDPNEKTIVTESFDSDFRIYNRFSERLNSKSYELIGYADYEYRGTYASLVIESDIVENLVFNDNKEGRYKYSVNYKNMYGSFNFTKERSFLEFEDIVFNGTTCIAAKFDDEYQIDNLDTGEKYNFSQLTFYAKGIGMIKYIRRIPGEEIRILELKQIITEGEFYGLVSKFRR